MLLETTLGRDFCAMMDIDDSFRVKVWFEIASEECYGVSPEFMDSIRQRGFGVVVHDLNNDAHLYGDRARRWVW
jgi:hypothetical protein